MFPEWLVLARLVQGRPPGLGMELHLEAGRM